MYIITPEILASYSSDDFQEIGQYNFFENVRFRLKLYMPPFSKVDDLFEKVSKSLKIGADELCGFRITTN